MRKLIAAIAAILVPAAAFAGGYVVPNINARDIAMGGAAIAAQESASATYSNPAALSRLEGLNLSIGASLIDFRSTWSDSYGLYGPGGPADPVTMTPKGTFPPAIYAAYGFKLPRDMRAGVGAGLTVPGGGYVFWPGQWVGRNEIVTVDRKVFGVYLTGGVQVLPQLRVGGGLVYYRTTEHLKQGVNFLDNAGQIELGTAGGAVSYDLSAEVTPIRDLPLTFGIDYKHQGVQTLTGHAHAEGAPLALLPNLLDQGVTHVLTYPNQFNFGAAFQVIPPLLVTFGWTWERFHVYQQDSFVGDRGVSVIVPRNYKNGYTLRLGAEYEIFPGLRARAGILRDTSPSRPETLSPTLPDADSTALSLGLGFAVVPNLEVNAAYFHDWQDSITTKGSETFQGTYDTRANIYALSVVWKMGPTRK
jgi:long-chain fatty acid transport protein